MRYKLKDLVKKNTTIDDILELILEDKIKLWYFTDQWYDVSKLGISAYQCGIHRVPLVGIFMSSSGKKMRFLASENEEIPTEEELERASINIGDLSVTAEDKKVIEDSRPVFTEKKYTPLTNSKQISDFETRVHILQAVVWSLPRMPLDFDSADSGFLC